MFITEIAEVNINDYLEVKNTPDKQIIYAGKEGTGTLSIKLKNAVTEEMQVGVTCKLVVNAKERTEVGEILNEEEIPTYNFSGVLLDSEGNPLANKTLVIYPEPAIYVTTDENGYVNIPELTKEHNKIYVVENTSIEELRDKTEEEIRNIATSNTGITVSDDNITFANGYEATNVEMQENPKGYSFYGYLRDEEDNIVPNANLVIYSEIPHYIITDGRGYFYVHGLEEGSHEIYYLTGNINDIKQLNKQEVKASAKASANITTSTRKIVLSNKFKINDYKIEKDEIRKYNITFNTNGGTLDLETKEVTQNREYGNLPTPTKKGYTFQGWYLNDYHITSDVLVNTDKTHTLEARWSVNSYEVSFDSKGGSAVSTKLNVTYDETYGTLPTSTKKGYTFQGWYLNDTHITSDVLVSTDKNHTLEAKWKANTYKVTFSANNATLSVTTKNVTYGEKYGVLPTPTISGLTFYGWYLNDKMITKDSVVDITSDVTLKADYDMTKGKVYNYDYKNKEESLTIPCTGRYKLEVWGAQGGDAISYTGGYGGYSVGQVNFSRNEVVYINVGGAGKSIANSTVAGGYNGGGSAKTQSPDDTGGSGGGATHIATQKGLLSSLKSKTSSILIVAGGGGGGYYSYNALFTSSGGAGGGINGTTIKNGSCSDGRTRTYGANATQTAGGKGVNCGGGITQGAFGAGGAGTTIGWSSGGGGGYYGGGTGFASGAQGGSGYIGNSRLTSKTMYCYSCTASSNASTKTVSTTSVSASAVANNVKSGNGYARITYLGK